MDRSAAQDLLDLLHRAQNQYYAGGDSEALKALLTPDVRWTVPGHNALAGEYNGINPVLDYMRRRRRLAGATLRLVRRDILTGRGNRIAALTDGVAVLSGEVRTWETLGLYEVTDGRISGCWLVPLDAETFDKIWS